MGNEKSTGLAGTSPSFARFILWEILGIIGFLHILFYAPAKDITPLYFLGNSLVFVLIFPILNFYNQLKLPGILKALIIPLGFVFRLVMMISSAIWITYILYATGLFLGEVSCYLVVRDFWMFMAPFYAVDYFFFFEHLWGLSRVNFTFWSSVGMISDSVSGMVGGIYLGRVFISKWGMFFGDIQIQGLIWMIFILVGVALVVWFGNKTRKG